MKLISNAYFLVLLVALSACATDGPKDVVGSVAAAPSTGPVIKPAPKSQPAAVVSYLGAFPGSEIGKQLDERDRAEAARAEFEALDTGAAGTAHEWRNPANGHGGSVTPGQTYTVNDYSCRDYVHKLFVAEHAETVRGTACKQPDGSWRPLT